MLAIICGSRTSTASGSKIKTVVRIGSFLWLPFDDHDKAVTFLRGYRSGMARIWRTTFVLPKKTDTLYRRGFRFAWLCHCYGKKHAKDQFPEAFIVKKDGGKKKCP